VKRCLGKKDRRSLDLAILFTESGEFVSHLSLKKHMTEAVRKLHALDKSRFGLPKRSGVKAGNSLN
jgi:hypothetical protein